VARIFYLSIYLSIVFLALIGCKAEPQKVKLYSVRGVIVKVDPAGKSAAIDAEKIDGWMEAMTMDYPVHDAKLLEGLKAGDHITATAHVPEDLNYWIDDIHKHDIHKQ
jgi:Cu/Ag efflux protein CusF